MRTLDVYRLTIRIRGGGCAASYGSFEHPLNEIKQQLNPYLIPYSGFYSTYDLLYVIPARLSTPVFFPSLSISCRKISFFSLRGSVIGI